MRQQTRRQVKSLNQVSVKPTYNNRAQFLIGVIIIEKKLLTTFTWIFIADNKTIRAYNWDALQINIFELNIWQLDGPGTEKYEMFLLKDSRLIWMYLQMSYPSHQTKLFKDWMALIIPRTSVTVTIQTILSTRSGFVRCRLSCWLIWKCFFSKAFGARKFLFPSPPSLKGHIVFPPRWAAVSPFSVISNSSCEYLKSHQQCNK